MDGHVPVKIFVKSASILLTKRRNWKRGSQVCYLESRYVDGVSRGVHQTSLPEVGEVDNAKGVLGES